MRGIPRPDRTGWTGYLAAALTLSAALLAAGTPTPARARTGSQAEAPAKPEKPEKPAKPEKPDPRTKARIGQPAPDFTLKDTEGNEYHLADFTKEGKPVVLEWFNPDCPFVQKHHKLTRNMADTYAVAKANGVVWLAINSGAKGKQGSGVERNREAKKAYEIAYPILLDEDGTVGRLYGAKTTPDMFVIDPKGILVYSGAIDDAPNTTALGKTNYVKHALHLMLSNKPVEVAETKSYGCSVKYADPGKRRRQ